MGMLESFLKQIRELLATMTPAARIMSALMAGVIVVSLGWIITNQQSSKTEYVFGSQMFSDEELNKMERAMSEAGLRNYERVGNRLKVPSLERDQYIKAMAEGKALPSEWSSYVWDALESASNPLLPPSTLAERMKIAKQKDLARSFESMPGIAKAQVMHEEKKSRFGKDAQQSASVHLLGINNEPVSQEKMRQISRSVVAAFPGLKPENVYILDVGAGGGFQELSADISRDQQQYLQSQRQWESYYEEKIAPELRVYGDVKLGIIVELDPTITKDTEELKYDPTGTAMKQSNQRKDTKSVKAAPGGRPGADPNGAGGANKSQSLTAQVDQTAESKEQQEDLESLIGHSATIKREAGLTPKRVSVTVGIPESYYDNIHMQRELAKKVKDPQPLDDAGRSKLKKEVEDNVRAAIEGQLPQVRQGDDRFQLVKVYSYTSVTVPEPPKPSFAETALAWLAKSWQTMGLFALLGVTLIMMFSWVRAQGSPEKDREFSQGFGLEVPESMGDSLELGDEQAPESSEQEENESKFEVTGGEIKEELSSLIKQNPDAAVNLLRSWIGEAA